MNFKSIICLSLAFLSLGTKVLAGDLVARPVPKTVHVSPSDSRKSLWASLSPKEKSLAYHLIRAANSARPLLFFQSHRHALVMEAFFETALNKKNLSRAKEILGGNFNEFINYAALFDDQHGPYGPSNRKLLMQTVTSDQVSKLLELYAPKLKKSVKQEITQLLTDPQYEVLHHPETADGAGLETCGTNMFEKGITASELNSAVKAGLKIELNSYVGHDASGKLVAIPQALNQKTLDPIVLDSLKNTIKELKKALPSALTDHQKKQIELTVKFLQDGNVEDFRNLNIEWVKDGTHSRVDLVMGWTETYMDHLTQIGSWESYVQILDPKLTANAQKLSGQAQYFENKMPYGSFKKTFPADYAPPAILANWFHEVSNSHVSGFNLPNFDDIRIQVGAKNSIRIRPEAERKTTYAVSIRPANIAEYSSDKVRTETVDKYFDARNLIVLLHEIIGHGSGTYDKSKYGKEEDPTGALGAFGGALEEERADLTALLFMDDPKMVEIGIFKDQEAATKMRNIAYDGYLTEFMSYIAYNQNFNEAHLRGHLILMNDLMAAGAIALESKDGSSHWTPENVVLAVKDYELYKKVTTNLLAELQDIKANRKVSELNALFAKRAPLSTISESWVQGVIKRGEKIEVTAGAIDQPWYIDSALKFKTQGGTTVEDSISERLKDCGAALMKLARPI